MPVALDRTLLAGGDRPTTDPRDSLASGLVLDSLASGLVLDSLASGKLGVMLGSWSQMG